MSKSSDDNEQSPAAENQANPGYAAAQLAKALNTAQEHADPATRARAESKAKKWADVIKGMFSGSLNVGSRAAVRDAPLWATPEVVHGGFVTGRLMAGGVLSADEKAVAKHFGLSQDRASINGSFLTEAGLAELLRDG